MRAQCITCPAIGILVRESMKNADQTPIVKSRFKRSGKCVFVDFGVRLDCPYVRFPSNQNILHVLTFCLCLVSQILANVSISDKKRLDSPQAIHFRYYIFVFFTNNFPRSF